MIEILMVAQEFSLWAPLGVILESPLTWRENEGERGA